MAPWQSRPLGTQVARNRVRGFGLLKPHTVPARIVSPLSVAFSTLSAFQVESVEQPCTRRRRPRIRGDPHPLRRLLGGRGRPPHHVVTPTLKPEDKMTQDKRRGAGRRRAGIGIVTLCRLHVLEVEPQNPRTHAAKTPAEVE